MQGHITLQGAQGPSVLLSQKVLISGQNPHINITPKGHPQRLNILQVVHSLRVHIRKKKNRQGIKEESHLTA